MNVKTLENFFGRKRGEKLRPAVWRMTIVRMALCERPQYASRGIAAAGEVATTSRNIEKAAALLVSRARGVREIL